MIHQVILQLERLYNALIAKSFAFENILKMGRTQLQDAVPVRLGQCFNAYATMVSRDIDRLIKSLDEMKTVNLGATAIGTSINAPLSYVKNIVPTLKTVVNLDLKQARDLIDATQNIDCFVAVSGILKTCAVNLSKMCNDLRLLSSGPKTGIPIRKLVLKNGILTKEKLDSILNPATMTNPKYISAS